MNFPPEGVIAKLAFLVGLVAVAFFLLSYLQKRRRSIIALNVTSRVLYIFQYILLGAFVGAVLDVAGTLASVLAQKKDKPFIKRHLRAVILGADALIVLLGLLTIYLQAAEGGYSPFSWQGALGLLPVFGVLLHTGAFWLEDERRIRIVSLLGSPFWFAYNLLSAAYGSCVGDLLSMVFILVAMFRYDFRGSRKKHPPAEK